MSYALIALGYLLGSLPIGWLVGRCHGIDIMAVGSGNTGATNVWRSCGAKAGALVMALDIGKGYLPTLVAVRLAPEQSGLHVAVAAAAILGHSLCIWLGFRGGKGVATACGAVIALDPLAAAVGLATFFGVIALTRYVSLGSLTSSVALAAVVSCHHKPTIYLVVVWLAVAWIWFRHRGNIVRLWRGEEHQFVARGGNVPAPSEPPEPAA